MSNKQNKTKNVVQVMPELLICAVTAVLMLVTLTVIFAVSGKHPVTVGIITTFAYILICAAALMILRRRRSGVIDEETVSPYLGDIMTDAMMNIALPSAICSERGGVIWNNGAFQELAGELGSGGKLRGKQLASIIPVKFTDIAKDSADGVPCEAGSLVMRVKGYRFRVNGKLFYMVSVYDRTEAENLYSELHAERTLVAYIQIDNLSELALFEQGQYRDASRDVDTILKQWADSAGGLLREYERNKYIFVFKERNLDEFTLRKFDVLDRVREIRVGEGFMPVTVSIGISRAPGTLAECERASFAALDTALARGGDQVVVRWEGGTEFYGGRTKAVQKRTKVRSRVIVNELAMHIARSDNVLIMGHKYPDFDSIGACIGAARLSLHCGANVHIIADVNDENIRGCVSHVLPLSGYDTIFVDETTALDMIRSDTLVIICDVNNFAHIAAPDVAAAAHKIVIIDHHIKTADPPKEALISYIEPSASSTCELLADMLEQLFSAGGLQGSEADVMYAGILLDTKQLSRGTTPRTFSAAMYLQSCGANPETAANFFRAPLEDFTREAKFECNVTIYRSSIAIACCTEEGSPPDRVAAAKAADKLLTVKGVTAAFTAVNIGDIVHISARSSGDINVQLILERLGGGGHFDVAGAQLKNARLDDALKNLKAAIDGYFADINRTQEDKEQS